MKLNDIRDNKGARKSRVRVGRGIGSGLGLNKMHRTVELTDTPEVRGMIRRVQHMVSVEG